MDLSPHSGYLCTRYYPLPRRCIADAAGKKINNLTNISVKLRYFERRLGLVVTKTQPHD